MTSMVQALVGCSSHRLQRHVVAVPPHNVVYIGLSGAAPTQVGLRS